MLLLVHSAVGQVVTVQGAAASITDADGLTGSTDNILQLLLLHHNKCTVSEAITVANNVVLLASTNGGDEIVLMVSV